MAIQFRRMSKIEKDAELMLARALVAELAKAQVKLNQPKLAQPQVKLNQPKAWHAKSHQSADWEVLENQDFQKAPG